MHYLCIHAIRMKDCSAIWTYNMEKHFTDQHQNYILLDTQLPPNSKHPIMIFQFEQVVLHISEGSLCLESVAREEDVDSASNLQLQVGGVEGIG